MVNNSSHKIMFMLIFVRYLVELAKQYFIHRQNSVDPLTNTVTAHHPSQFWAKWIQPSHSFISLISILIPSSHTHKNLHMVFILLVFHPKFCTHLSAPMHTT